MMNKADVPDRASDQQVAHLFTSTAVVFERLIFEAKAATISFSTHKTGDQTPSVSIQKRSFFKKRV